MIPRTELPRSSRPAEAPREAATVSRPASFLPLSPVAPITVIFIVQMTFLSVSMASSTAAEVAAVSLNRVEHHDAPKAFNICRRLSGLARNFGDVFVGLLSAAGVRVGVFVGGDALE